MVEGGFQMNTDVQRTHKIIVGICVGVIAAAGISVVAVDVHRAVLAKTTLNEVPTALAGSSLPDESQPPQAAPPPPMTSGMPVADTRAAASADTASRAPSAQLSAAPSKAAQQGSSSAAARQPHSVSKPAADPAPAYGAPGTRVAEETAMAIVPARDDVSTRAAVQVGASSAASGEPALSDNEVTTTAQARMAGGDSVNSDRMITRAVQSKIAADTADQGADLEITTINGVVILTGTVPTAAAAEHVKQVVQQVKDVKGVDATAVRVSSS
jgi:hyperosmotically inducible periplasmic protein